ncbi:hypothetical protein NX059_009166 [Plenodomus lindquistii]|nr:hypothetical protein NX059_009166 [Plenodomus lindquistii]
MAIPSVQARLTIQDAFERFAETVQSNDRRDFQNTKLQDVRNEAMRIEGQLRARRTQRNMARLEPFLLGMEHYARVIEVLCNGTPYLSWIWAPVKLMLMITVDSLTAFEKLIDAYGRIADMLPRIDRLDSALGSDHNFQSLLALIYADILEFHRRAYKFVRRSSWHTFFGSMWAGFESRFSGILAQLAYHSKLLDEEAIAIDISNTIAQSREQALKWEQQEQEWRANKVRVVLSWLATGAPLPEDALDRHSEQCLPDSCNWFIQDVKTQRWLKKGAGKAMLWLTGKPGAGKSTLCSTLIQHAQSNAFDVLFYFCTYLDNSAGTSSRILRSLASQIIQKHQDFAIHVYDVYFQSHPVPTRKALLCLLPELLQGIGPVRLVIDGVDECSASDQVEVLKDMAQLHALSATLNCKVLIASRDTLNISRSMHRRRGNVVTTSLSDSQENLSMNRSIEHYIDGRLADLPSHLLDLDPDGSILAEVKQTLTIKSNGKLCIYV